MSNSDTIFKKIDLISNKKYKAIGYAYICVDTIEFDYSEEVGEIYQSAIINTLEHKKGRCNICNKKITNLVVVKNADTEDIHLVGRNCGEHISDFGMQSNRLTEFSLKASIRAKKKKKITKVLADNEGLLEALQMKNMIINEIGRAFKRTAKLTPKQISYIMRLAEAQRKRETK